MDLLKFKTDKGIQDAIDYIAKNTDKIDHLEIKVNSDGSYENIVIFYKCST